MTLPEGQDEQLATFIESLGFQGEEESDNPAYRMFLS